LQFPYSFGEFLFSELPHKDVGTNRTPGDSEATLFKNEPCGIRGSRSRGGERGAVGQQQTTFIDVKRETSVLFCEISQMKEKGRVSSVQLLPFLWCVSFGGRNQRHDVVCESEQRELRKEFL
jgi:hypothetical protein